MAAKPIITQIKDRFEILLNSLSIISQVYMCPTKPIDRSTAVFPFTAVFDIYENWENRNRLEQNEITFHIETWFKGDTGSEDLVTVGDFLEATIHDAIMSDFKDGTLHNLTQKAEKRAPERNYENIDMGVIIQKYYITYLNTFGNSFTNKHY